MKQRLRFVSCFMFHDSWSMLDIKFIRENPDKVKEACKNKNVDLNGLSVDWFIDSEKEKRTIQAEIENLRAEQNRISRGGKDNESLISQAKELKERIKNLEPKLSLLEAELKNFLLSLPNIPFDDVSVGKDDSENKVLRKVSGAFKLPFAELKDYMELGEDLDIIDTKIARPASSLGGVLVAVREGLEVLKSFKRTISKEKESD